MELEWNRSRRRWATAIILCESRCSTASEGSRWIGAVRSVKLIVINDHTAGLFPNLDAEFVHTSAAGDQAADSGQQEAVISGIVDGPRTLVLSARSRNLQPVIAATMKAKIGDLELKLRLACWNGRAFLVFGNEAETGFAGQARPAFGV